MDTQSFCQNSEEIDPLTLPCVLLVDREHLKIPREQGIYFVIDSENEIHYIGSSYSIRQRFECIANVKRKFAHLNNPRIAYHLMLHASRDAVYNDEAALINFYRPLMNLRFCQDSRYSTKVKPTRKSQTRKIVNLTPNAWDGLERFALDLGFDSDEDFLEVLGTVNIDQRLLAFLMEVIFEKIESNVIQPFLPTLLHAIANRLETL